MTTSQDKPNRHKWACVFVTIMFALVCMIALTACRPTYSKDNITQAILEQLDRDWDFEIQKIKYQNSHIGVVIKETKMWGQDGKLIQEVYTDMMNAERTIERVLISSDAEVDTISVLVSSQDSAINLVHRRPFAEIRKKRTGTISWQQVFDTEEVEQVPCWQWPDFDEPVYHYEGMIEEEFIAMLNLQFAAALYPNNQNAPVPQDNSTSIFSNLSNTSQVSTQQNFPIQVALEDETLAVLYRISTLGDIENLSEETENRILAALNIVEIAALKTDIPIVRVSSTLSGTDSWQNITYIELMDNIRQQVQGELTREERLETIVKKTTPFWEWHGIGEVDLFSQEQLLTRSKSAIVKDLKLDGRINVQDQSLFFDLKTLKSSLSDDEVRQKTQNLFETVEDDVLLAIPAIDNLVLKITDNSDDSTICFGRDMGAARHYRENIIDKNSYELSLIQLDKSQCP